MGSAHVLIDEFDKAPYLADWRKRYHGDVLAVLLPGTTREVVDIVKLCAQHHVGVTPQGGNTGLSGGATPCGNRSQIVLCLKRLNGIRGVDVENRTITVEAGCVLQSVHDVAAQYGQLFPLSLGSQGSCTVGGLLSTNAGGTAVLRYGNARDLCLGLEVVTPAGETWDGLKGLRKDNTGYALRDLFIGAEGSLGIITAAVLKLLPQPRVVMTCLVACPTVSAAVALLGLSQKHANSLITTFELISASCLDYVARYFPEQPYPFESETPYAVLIELSDQESEAHSRAICEQLLEDALSKELITDALIAQSVEQTRKFWGLREHIPLAQAQEGPNIKHDISLPASNMAKFVAETDAELRAAFPGCRIINFGHLGDGNLHYNVAGPEELTPNEFMFNEEAVDAIIYRRVMELGGSFSAEHGIGQAKLPQMSQYKSAVELGLLRRIKEAIDPQWLMNPGKVLPD